MTLTRVHPSAPLRIRVAISIALAFTATSGCGDGDSLPHPNRIYEELIDNGTFAYRGAFPADEVLGTPARRIYRWDPDVPSGPRCIGTDDPTTRTFEVETRDRGSEDLMIYLQGGGLCSNLSVGSCERTSIPFVPLGVLSNAPDNPLRSHNLVYVPYCDGSLFLGDVEQTIDGELYVQRGRQNIMAALDAAAASFPNPRRISLVGVSGGAFSTIFAAPLVRVYFPDAEVTVISDDGVGITRGTMEPDFVDELLRSIDAFELVPSSCTQCFTGGHALRFLDWILERDPTLRYAVISHARDTTIAPRFLEVPLEWFEQELRRETAAMSERYGDRYGRYIIDGEGHTSLLAASVSGEGDMGRIYAWLTQFLSEDPAWTDVEQ